MKKKSSNEKVTLYIAIFFILFLGVILLLYFLGVIGGEKPTIDAVLNNEIIVKYSKDKWEKVDKENYSDYNWKKFKVYEEGKKKGTYSLYTSEETFYLFKEEPNKRTPIDTLEESLYLGGKKESEFIEFNKDELSDKDVTYINSVLKKNSISGKDLTNYIRGYKIVKDFDNDDEKEEMYVLSNIFNDDVENKAYSLIFIKDGSKTDYIYKNIVSSDDRLKNCKIDLLGLIRIEKESDVQIITKCSYYSYKRISEYGIFKNNNNKYELLLYIK